MNMKIRSFKLKIIFSYILVILISFGFIAFFIDKNLERNSLHSIETSLTNQAYLVGNQITVENLKKEGYKAYIEISDLGDKGTWYRVRIGGLANETEAKALLETIRKSFNSGIIIKPKV